MGNNLDSLTSLLWLFAILVPIAYVYMAAVLTVLARKTATGPVWLAWVPIANLVLMCRIGRKPGLYVLLFFIPLVNIIGLVLVWMAIARVRGKSHLLGLLMIVPIVNFVVPLILASGPPTSAATPASPSAAAAPAECPACGRAECVGDEFCGYTGQRIRSAGTAAGAATAATLPTPVAPADMKPGLLAKVILGLILLAGVSYFAFGLLQSGKKMFSGGAQPGAARLPQRMAGTLSEFPVDTDGTPGRPTSVIAQNLQLSPKDGRSKLPPKSLPQALPESKLSQVADTMTSAMYQARPVDPPVSVHVMNTTEQAGPQSRRIAEAVSAGSASAEMSGIRVQSPAGAEYTGFRVRTPETVTYVMDKTGASIVIIVYAPDPSVKALADRLAANVGNGSGLLEDEAAQSSLAALPAQLPAGIQLAETNTYSGAALEGTMDQFRSALGNDFGPEANQWIDEVKSVMPPQLTTARYVDQAARDFKVAVGDYGSSLKAWVFWQLLRATVSLTGMKPVSMNGGDAYSSVDEGTEYLLFRRGGCLGLVAGPDDKTGRTLRMAEAIQR